ncbi:hypothetical protein M378DRAFT_166103 [Amanita muscaria Koide BX008]|uniref:Uncharacterized protein n=1 Tax=Amanita muscaria (strain Koide BX008) TaxID=946122 RepID=A0A0C2WZ29_AMAMK|nr:hypothetical protein M378DRAFT_166103 [Amanita muscaria Koide BX008]
MYILLFVRVGRFVLVLHKHSGMPENHLAAPLGIVPEGHGTQAVLNTVSHQLLVLKWST